MALTPDEISLLQRHKRNLDSASGTDILLERYADGEQRVKQLGMAVPPEFRDFLTIVNWPGMYVESVEARQDVKSISLPGSDVSDPRLRAIMDANNLDSELSMWLWDRYVYGRAHLSVGANEDDPSLPLIHVESPREMDTLVDPRTRRITSAARFYGLDESGIGPLNVTLYLPDQTIWLEKTDSRWEEVDRDQHQLGRVPVVTSLCRRRSGVFQGRSLMSNVIGLTDSAARALTNLQFAGEAHGVPQRYALGVASGDFVDKDGNPIPAWEAYFNAVWANKNPNVKVGQFTASDLKNFETQLNLYGRLGASVTYLPTRYFGLSTTNPPSADSIRAEEAQLVKFVERQNKQVGAVLGWAASLAYRFATGEWIDGNQVGVMWHDPATPTTAQKMDATVKAKQAGIVSREGAWDELGWSETRKDQERGYFAAEPDPELAAVQALTNGNA